MPAIIRFSLPDLKKIMKENKIKGTTTMNKPEILKLLRERDHVPAEALIPTEKPVKVVDPKYEFTKFIRNSPHTVSIEDRFANIETQYP